MFLLWPSTKIAKMVLNKIAPGAKIRKTFEQISLVASGSVSK